MNHRALGDNNPQHLPIQRHKYLWTFYCLQSEKAGNERKLKNNKNKVNKFRRTSSDHLLLAKDSFLCCLGSLLLHACCSIWSNSLMQTKKYKRRAIWAEGKTRSRRLFLLHRKPFPTFLNPFSGCKIIPESRINDRNLYFTKGSSFCSLRGWSLSPASTNDHDRGLNKLAWINKRIFCIQWCAQYWAESVNWKHQIPFGSVNSKWIPGISQGPRTLCCAIKVKRFC